MAVNFEHWFVSHPTCCIDMEHWKLRRAQLGDAKGSSLLGEQKLRRHDCNTTLSLVFIIIHTCGPGGDVKKHCGCCAHPSTSRMLSPSCCTHI
uniref:Uncharacterized protein n=1 Tax=Ascaris lumbricoides TaxID=6252 RepID=A0A0M3I7A3_ASCLU